MPAKWCLDYDMKHVYLRQMLEWRVETEHGWAVPVGFLGKGLKKRLPPDIWRELEQTFAGAGLEDNWEALERTLALFRRVGVEVGARLGYRYPDDLHNTWSHTWNMSGACRSRKGEDDGLDRTEFREFHELSFLRSIRAIRCYSVQCRGMRGAALGAEGVVHRGVHIQRTAGSPGHVESGNAQSGLHDLDAAVVLLAFGRQHVAAA